MLHQQNLSFHDYNWFSIEKNTSSIEITINIFYRKFEDDDKCNWIFVDESAKKICNQTEYN